MTTFQDLIYKSRNSISPFELEATARMTYIYKSRNSISPFERAIMWLCLPSTKVEILLVHLRRWTPIIIRLLSTKVEILLVHLSRDSDKTRA